MQDTHLASPDTAHDAPSPREYWCRLNGMRLRAHVWHEDRPGLPLVFLNGVGTSLEIVPAFAAQFPERRFIAIEMPGAGLTSPTDLPLHPTLLARLAVDAAAQLGAERFDLMGLSLGGALAQQIALQYRDRVNRLILAGTCSGVTMVPHDWGDASLLGTLNPFAAVLNDLANDLSGPHLQSMIWPTPAALAGQFSSFVYWSSLPILPMIEAETLVLAGARDRIIAPANALQLSAFIPGADHYILPDAGHIFPFTHPDLTADRVKRFLAKSRTGRRAETAA